MTKHAKEAVLRDFGHAPAPPDDRTARPMNTALLPTPEESSMVLSEESHFWAQKSQNHVTRDGEEAGSGSVLRSTSDTVVVEAGYTRFRTAVVR